MKTVKFQAYSDPGHGWVRVPHKLLAKLGIAALITPYSYMRNEYAYLEEDCDLSTFILAMERAGKKPEFTTHTNRYRQSRIRNYETYAPRNPVVTPAPVATEVVETE